MRSLVFALALAAAIPQAHAADLIGFWDKPQHGGNSFNPLPPDQAYFDALRGYGEPIAKRLSAGK
ncbi:hypothetical protein ACHMW7_10495 [Aminobacter sp. UC22_36]|uniref:hypothetical protein n=1 Tax=Aminobacter sp. UC22_36 TaxID=3374549 RepID=UPI00375726B8